MKTDRLVLGIDGGGTKTVAWLADRDPAGDRSVIGRGISGPANPQTVGLAKAAQSVGRAVAAAFEDAAVELAPVSAAVLALAGSDRDENRTFLQDWAKRRRLARRFRLVNDAVAVLAAGSPDGSGVALIAGTGSLAFGLNPAGHTARAGGWGFRFGDEGSGYAIAVAGLRAAAKYADGRGPETRLLEKLLARLEIHKPPELISAISRMGTDPATIAALAGTVCGAAEEGDAVARRIVDEAAGELASMISAVVRKLGFATAGFPLALAGGALLGSETLQRCLNGHLDCLGLSPDPVAEVPEPVAGAVKLARADAAGR